MGPGGGYSYSVNVAEDHVQRDQRPALELGRLAVAGDLRERQRASAAARRCTPARARTSASWTARRR